MAFPAEGQPAWCLWVFRSCSSPPWEAEKRIATSLINAKRKGQKGQAWRGFGGEHMELAAARSEKKTARARAPGPRKVSNCQNSFWPALKESFSVPTTWT